MAMPNLDQLLETDGDVLALTAGGSRVFGGTGSVWFLREGEIELFAVQRKNAEQTGPREHLCSLSAGALIWGIDQNPGADGIHLLGSSVGDSRLSRVDTAAVARWGTDAALAAALAGALDQWIAGLSRGVTKHIAPRKSPRRSIAAGDVLGVAEADRIVSHKGVTWAQLQDGGGAYIDIKEIGAAAMVPLTVQGWLSAGSVRTLRGATTAAVLQSGRISGHMTLFHQSIIHVLAYGFRNAASIESARLTRRAAQLTTDTENVFVGFARLFDARIHRRAAPVGGDALFECCAAVGKAMDIAMVLPPFAKRRRAEEPPLTIADIASASQLRVRRVTLPAGWWAAENGPMVGFRRDDGKPVALLQKSSTITVVHDPAAGTEQVVTELVAATLSPEADTFYASLPDRAASPLDLIGLCVKQCKADLVAIIMAGALGGLIATAIPMATGYVFDSVIPGHQTAQMLQAAVAVVAAAFAAAAFELTRNIAQLRVEGRISGVVQAAFMDRLLRLPVTFFAGYSSGDLAQRTMVVEIARKTLTGVVVGALVSGAFSVFSFGLLVYYAPIAAIVAALLAVVLAGVTLVTGLSLLTVVTGVQEVSGRINSLVLEIITGIAKLRVAGAEERAFNNWGSDFGELRRREIAAFQLHNRFSVFWVAYEVLGLGCIFAVIGLIGQSGMTTGAFLAFVAAFNGLLVSLFALAKALIAVFSVVPLYRRAGPILKAVPENDVTKGDPGTLSGEVEVNGVFFRYAPNMPYVLDGLSLRAGAGERIAVVGASGSGKSTLMRLLLGLDHPEAGALYFDGRDLRGLNLRSVRRQIGVVMQNGRLMPGSIYENIKGATRATVDECWETAAKVGLDDDIMAMPMRMHTVLTEGATALSGGQVQRLLIARSLVGRPAVLLLDEATSALDNKTQNVVMSSLDRLSVTRIVIAHRLSTIINADRIYVLKNGRIAESGSYEQLMGGGGIFTTFAFRQRL